MNVDKIILKPITTPEYPDPTEARRYVDDEDGFYGYDYVFLEDAIWHALCEIAHEKKAREQRREAVRGLAQDYARITGDPKAAARIHDYVQRQAPMLTTDAITGMRAGAARGGRPQRRLSRPCRQRCATIVSICSDAQ